MWQFDYPWLFLLLPLPWAAWRYLPIYQEARRAVRTPFFRAISQAVGVSPQQSGVQQARRQLLLNLLVWVLLICALARPVWVEPPCNRPARCATCCWPSTFPSLWKRVITATAKVNWSTA